MNKSAELRKYMMKRFLWAMVFIGGAEILITTIIRRSLAPYLESLLMLGRKIEGTNLRAILGEVLNEAIILALSRFGQIYTDISKLLNEDLVRLLLGNDTLKRIDVISRQFSNLATDDIIARLLIFAFIIAVVWLLPYILGGLYYSRSVSRKVVEIEKERIDREHEYDKQKNLLLSDIAHDIKTPITSIAGFSKALSDGTIKEEERQKYLDSIYNKSMQVSDLVSLLFEYVKLDSSGYTLNKTDVDICELARNCVARVYADFEEKNMEVDIDIPDEPIMVKADRMQMERAIGNLLNNTIKHNPEGTSVFILLKDIRNSKRQPGPAGKTKTGSSTAGNSSASVVFEIADTGVKIDHDIAVHLFEPFVQGDASRTSGSGSGLGLSITRKIVEMHGGSILLKQYLDPKKYGRTKSFEVKL